MPKMAFREERAKALWVRGKIFFRVFFPYPFTARKGKKAERKKKEGEGGGAGPAQINQKKQTDYAIFPRPRIIREGFRPFEWHELAPNRHDAQR
jgi:hypothetical protein